MDSTFYPQAALNRPNNNMSSMYDNSYPDMESGFDSAAGTQLKTQLDAATSKKATIESELSKLKTDPTMLDIQAKMDRVNSQMYSCRASTSGTIVQIVRKRVHDACKDDTNCQERPWQAGNGEIWCGSDSTTAYNTAASQLNAWRSSISSKQTQLDAVNKEIKELNDKLIAYANTNAGKQEVKDKGEVEIKRAESEQIAVAAQAEAQRLQARTQSSNKKIMLISTIIISLISIAVFVWWLRKRKTAKK